MAIKIKKIIIFSLGLLLVANQASALFGGPSVPSAGETMNKVEKAYGFDKNVLRRSKRKVDAPTAELYFDNTKPKEGEKVTANAYGLRFKNTAEDLYYTWYILRDNDKYKDEDGNYRDDAIEIGKREAMGMVARGDYDPFLFGEDYTVDEDDDGFKAPFGGAGGVGAKTGSNIDGIGAYESQHMADKQRGVVDKLAITGCYRHNFGSKYGGEKIVGHSGEDLIVECKHKFATAPKGEIFEGTVLEDGGGAAGLTLKCEGNHEVGDGSFGVKEEECWRLNPKSSDTDGDGFSDEEDLAGRGQDSLTWTYQEGDRVGVIIEGTSLIAINARYKNFNDFFSGKWGSFSEETKAYTEYLNQKGAIQEAQRMDELQDVFDPMKESFIGGGYLNKNKLLSCFGSSNHGQGMDLDDFIGCIDSAGDVTDWGGVIDLMEYKKGEALGLDFKDMRTEGLPDDIDNDLRYPYTVIGLIDGLNLRSNTIPFYHLNYQELEDALTRNIDDFMDSDDERYKLDGPEVVDALSAYPDFYDANEQLSGADATDLASELNTLNDDGDFNDANVGDKLEAAGIYDPNDSVEDGLLGDVVAELNIFLAGNTNLSSAGDRLELVDLPDEINDLWLNGNYEESNVENLLEEYGIYDLNTEKHTTPPETEDEQLSEAVSEIEKFLSGTKLQGSRVEIEDNFQDYIDNNVLLADDLDKDPRISEQRAIDKVSGFTTTKEGRDAYYKIMWAGTDICSNESESELKADECESNPSKQDHDYYEKENTDHGFTYLATSPVFQQTEEILETQITISPEEPELNTQTPLFSDRIMAASHLEDSENDKKFVYYDWELLLCDNNESLAECGESGEGTPLTFGCGDGDPISECAQIPGVPNPNNDKIFNSDIHSSGMGVDWIDFQPTEYFIESLNSEKAYLKIALKTKTNKDDEKMALSKKVVPLKKNNLGIKLYKTDKATGGNYFFDEGSDEICDNQNESSGVICPLYPYQTIAAKASMNTLSPDDIKGYYWEINGKRVSTPQTCNFNGGCSFEDIVYLPIVDGEGEEQSVSLSVQVEENGVVRNLTSERPLLVKEPMALIKSEDGNAWNDDSLDIFYTEVGNRVEFRADMVQYYLDSNDVDFTWFINNREVDVDFIQQKTDLDIALDENKISFDVPGGFDGYSLKVKTAKEVTDDTKDDMDNIWGMNVYEDEVSEENSILLKKKITPLTAQNSNSSVGMFLASTIHNTPQYLLFSIKAATVMVVAWFLLFGLSYFERPLRTERE